MMQQHDPDERTHPYLELKRFLSEEPNDKALLQRFLEKGQYQNPREVLVQLQTESPSLIPSVMAYLSEWEGFRKFCTTLSEKSYNSRNPSIYKELQIWYSVGYGHDIPECCAEVNLESTRLFSIYKAGCKRLISVFGKDDNAVTDAAKIGVDLKAFAKYLNNFLKPGPNWASYLENASYPTESARRTVASCEKFCGFQDEAVRQGFLEFRDPFSGSLARSIDSFFAFGRACYFFKGRVPFFLICAGAGSKAVCLYVPRFDVIFDFRAGLAKYLGQELFANLINIMTKRFSRNLRRYNSVIAKGDDLPDTVAVTIAVPQIQNPAHHVWNSYTGLERLALAGLLERTERVCFGGSEFFGPLADLYPEIADRIEHGDRQSVMDPHPFSPEHLVLTVGGYYIPKTLINRLYNKLYVMEPRRKSVSPGDIDNLDHNRPVVWFGMRVGDKSWLHQEDGIVEISSRIFSVYPNALILLDGFSFPVGRDDVTSKWAASYEKLYELGERIRVRLGSTDAVINMVGNSLRESVLWAREVDVYVSPVGSTQHKIGWFTDAEGIVYSSPRGARPLNWHRLPGAWESEGSQLPHYIIGTPLEAGERRGVGDRRAHLENMDLDLDDLCSRVLSSLAGRLSMRSSLNMSQLARVSLVEKSEA